MGRRKTREVLTDLLLIGLVCGSVMTFGLFTMKEIGDTWVPDPVLTIEQYSDSTGY